MKKLVCVLMMALAIASCKKPEDSWKNNGTNAPTAISASPSSIDASMSGGTYTITVKAPAQPTALASESWVSISSSAFRNYQTTLTVTVDPNPSSVNRSAEITLTSRGASSVKIPVAQAARVDVGELSLPETGALAMSDALALGWNMGNHFDAYYSGSWAGANEGYPAEDAWDGVKATQATFDGVKAAGFTSTRIPISWLKMIGDAPDYKINEVWMNRIYEVVQYAHTAGLYVIINTHHDENHGVDNTYQWLDIKNAAADPALNETIKAKIKAVWAQIAEKFASCGDWLIFESFNELNDGGWGWSDEFKKNPKAQCNILNEWNQVFVDAVRATGGINAVRWLGIPTYAASPDFEKYATIPSDPAGKVMLAVHYYDPYDYTIGDKQYPQWGHTAAAGKKPSDGEERVQSVFGNLHDKYVAKDIPVYIGEFGCSMRDKNDAVAYAFFSYYLEYIVKAAKEYGMPCFLWDNGAIKSTDVGQEKHGYINHETGEIGPNAAGALQAMNRARYTEDAAYTLQSVYDSAPRF